MQGLDNKWIHTFTVYAFDQKKLCRAELSLQIDWTEHEAQLAVGRTTISVNDKWVDNTAIEVDEATRAFNEFVNSLTLSTEWRISLVAAIYESQAKKQQVFKALNLVDGQPVKWAEGRRKVSLEVPELPELQIGITITG